MSSTKAADLKERWAVSQAEYEAMNVYTLDNSQSVEKFRQEFKNNSAAARYFENVSGRKLPMPKVKIKLDDYLQKSIFEDRFYSERVQKFEQPIR